MPSRYRVVFLPVETNPLCFHLNELSQQGWEFVTWLADSSPTRKAVIRRTELEDQWITIDELVAQYEKDPVMRQHLRAARKRIAPFLYKADDPRYERMMRGEGPPRNKVPVHVDATGQEREPPHCPTCCCLTFAPGSNGT